MKLWNLLERIVYIVLKPVFNLLHKDLTDDIFKSFMQFVKFGLVGVSNTIVSYSIYACTLMILKWSGVYIRYDFLIAQITAFLLSVLWSFYWNSRKVFTIEEGKHRSKLRTLIKTYVSYSFTGLFLNSVLLILLIDILHVSAFIAPVVNIAINVPINFLLNKFWAYKQL